MQVDLIKYMKDRMQDDCAKAHEPGPVITISREYGCPAKKIAQKVTDILTEKMIVKGHKHITWRMITKEIMSESARALDVDPSQIKYIFDYEQKGLIDNILSAQVNKYYKSDLKIKNTIGKVIRNIACEGHAVIVGRGGVALTRDLRQSLHIHLEAPLEWRALRTSEKQGITIQEAEIFAKDIDAKRKQFRDYFQGKNTNYTEFDLTFNCMTMSIDEIAYIIVKACELRKLI